ncbi:MAG: substrate-binding domain-containing protein [Treponema sp.]|nr:substrate-binding domain-containing protein [Treponema sp.]
MKKYIKKQFTLSLLFIFCAASFTGCSKQKGQSKSINPQQTEKKITIGFSIDTLAIERWQRDLDVFMNKVRDLGADVIVQNAGNSIEVQNQQLMYLVDKDVDVIVVLPKDTDAISESVQKIKSKGISVISYDRLTRNADVDLYVSINSREVGEQMARNLQHYVHGTNWFCILGAKEDYNMTLIQEGISSILKYTPYRINHTFYTSGWNYDLAYQEVVRLVSENQIPDAIVCGNDAIADSVLSALSLYYPEKHIPICGQDADIAACQNIVNGKQEFTLYKPIIELAEKTAEISVALAKGQKVEDIVPTNQVINNGMKEVPVFWLSPTLVDKTNIDEVVINSGFHTYGEVYHSN